ncbi:MAG: exopolysaccharide biosynthesis polyprenyl glycosylphosphotransferase [Cyclobacteriaceae bacterium]
MTQRSVNKIRLLIILLTDALLVAGTTGFILYYFIPDFKSFRILPTLTAIWIAAFIIGLRSSFFQNLPVNARVQSHFTQVFFSLGTLAIFIKFFPAYNILPEPFLLTAFSLTIISLPRIFIHQFLFGSLKISGKSSTVLLAGDGKMASAILEYFKNKPQDGTIIGYLNSSTIPSAVKPRLGNYTDIGKVFSTTPFERLIICLDPENKEVIEKLIDYAERQGIRASVVLNVPALMKRNFELSDLGGLPLFRIREVPLSDYIPLLWKRVFDVLFAVTALIFLSPILLIISALIKVDSSGPVFYRAERIGRQGRPFRIYKFRSMKMLSDPRAENRSTQKNDDRITGVGKILRRYSLDELPQLLNVLEGSMSVVGPRPHRVNLDRQFGELVPAYPVRRFIKPGITGWAQVNGWRGLTEKEIDFKGRALHDLWYLEHWSFGLDLAIVWLTIFGKRTHQNVF